MKTIIMLLFLLLAGCATKRAVIVNSKYEKGKKTEETKIYYHSDGANDWSPKDHVFDLELSLLNF